MKMEDNWLTRIDLFDNVKTEEPIENQRKQVACRFSAFGCTFKSARGTREMRKHMKKKARQHMFLLQKIVRYQDIKIKEQRERMRRYEESLRQVSQVIQEYKEEFDEQRRHVHSQKMMMKDLQNDVSKLRVTSRKQDENLSQKIEELSGKFDQFLLDYSISKSESDLKNSGRYGEHLWIIRNYSRRLRRIQSGKADDPVRSDPFYTGSPGYRLCIWVYLNGRGKYHGDAISIYGKVMAGDFDSILPWPIRPQFTFTLYEQNRSDSHREDIVRCRKVHEIKRNHDETPKISQSNGGIPRPLGDDRSIIVGFDNFVSHEELHTRGFLKSDNIFLKAEVEIRE